MTSSRSAARLRPVRYRFFCQVSECEEHAGSANHTTEEAFLDWKDIEETRVGDGLLMECELCRKPGTPRQQFEHMGIVICATDRAIGLQREGAWA